MRNLRATIGVLVGAGGVTIALTLVFLAMRAVMDVGGACASGGSFEIRQHCPGHVAAIMPGAIWAGLLFVGIYIWQTTKYHVPGMASLLWSALFLSLGWNFFEYAFDPPGPGGGVEAGWIVCGVVFALMGGFPLFFALPAVVRGFVHPERPSLLGVSGLSGGTWKASAGTALKVASAVGRRMSAAGLAEELERLDTLHRSGGLDDLEYAMAKDKVIREHGKAKG